MNTKNHVCPHDSRRFATKKALQQHMAVVHCPTAMVSVKTRKSSRRPRSSRGTLSTDVAPTRIPTPSGGSISVSGDDRLDAIEIQKDKSITHSFTISPSTSLRLGTISKAYQRIHWQMVEFIVTPQASAITNGGYVCGIVMDPSDEYVTAQTLSATQGSQTKKWYESAIVRMPSKADILYTSPGEDARLTSPGRFWIVSEGVPSSKLTLVVTMKWRVRLTHPTVENISGDSFILEKEIIAKGANYNVVLKDPCGSTTTEDFSGVIPDNLQQIPGKHFFRVPTFNIEYSEGAGDTGTMQMHFLVYSTSDKKMYYSSDGKNVDTTPWQGNVPTNQILVPSGTYLKYTGQGNHCARGVKLPGLTLKTSNQSSQRLESLFDRMEKLSTELQMLSSRSSLHSSLELIPKPTDLES